ncbi:MAG: 5-formyltetrahydrofolate cyclo-ligase [Cyclonatronaceae bacterium]
MDQCGGISKQSIRKKAKAFRSGLKIEEVDRISRLISLTVLQSAIYRDSRCILSYAPIEKNREIDTNRINHQILAEGKILVLPRMTSEPGEMELIQTTDLSLMYKNSLKIPEPVGDQVISLNSIDLILVPMLAGDHNMNRLGYGKGYYDRLLSNFRGTSCGLLYEECLFKRIPADDHDRPLDYIVTEKKILP